MLRFIIAALVVSAPALATTTKAKILVSPSKAESGISAGTASLLDEIMTTELSRDPRFDVVGWSDVTRALQVEHARQVAGCDTDGCLSEIGGALGADYILVSSLGQLGRSFLVNVRLLRLSTMSAERWSETIPASEDALADAVRRAVRGVLPPMTDSRHVAIYVALGIAGASAVAGAVVAGLDYEAVAQRNSSALDATTYHAQDVRAQRLTTGANVAWGLVGSAVVTSGVLWLVERFRR